MSGGHFDYLQFRFNDVIEELQSVVLNNGKPKTEEELQEDRYWGGDNYHEKYPEELKHTEYNKEIISEFKKAIKTLRKAEIYTNRIDYLLSGDDGEDNFIKRLREELKEV